MILRFDREGDAFRDGAGAPRRDAAAALYQAARAGGDARDRADYQTMFARAEGAVAAPTAGLHFTPACSTRSRRAASAGRR